MQTFWHRLPTPFFILAPMEAVTDVVFRHVVAQAGRPDVFFTEFTNATGWHRAGDKAIGGRLIKTSDEHPIVAQLWGSDPGAMAALGIHCAHLGYDGIDINMGCPDRSVEAQGAGAKLILNPERAVELVAAAKRGALRYAEKVGTEPIPVSVKTRLGYNKDILEEPGRPDGGWLAKILSAEPAALTLHARTRKEMSKVAAHWERVKRAVEIRDALGLTTPIIVTYNVTGEFSNTRNQSLDTSLYGDAVSVNGRLYNTNQNTTSVTHQQLLTYDKKFNKFGLQVLAGHETLDRQFDYMQTHVINGILVNSPYSDQFGIVNGISGYGSPYATEGYFARLNMDYAGKYFINANFRRDGSSRFHPDNRWGSFYGIGGAWIASKENFLSNVSWLNNLKFKASYGEQGNDNLGYNFPYLNQYSVVQTTNAAETTISMNQTFYGNKDITWEKNANLNIGFEVDLFNNRLSIDAEYFNRKSYDMLFMKPISLTSGFPSQPQNIGDMVNRGVEITTKFDVVRSENYKFTVNANTTYLENEILKLSQPEIVDGSYLLKPGNSRYTWRMREFVGVNSTNGAALFAVVNPTTGARTSTSTYASGTLIDTGKSAVPKFYGGFGFDFNVYKFDLGVNFAYQLGGWGYDSNWMTLMAMGLFKFTKCEFRIYNKQRIIRKTWRKQPSCLCFSR